MTNIGLVAGDETGFDYPALRRFEVTVPPNVQTVRVEAPVDLCLEGEALKLRIDGQADIPDYQGETLRVGPGASLVGGFTRPDKVEVKSAPKSRLRMWALARRFLCEGRDRLEPIFARK